MPEYNITLEEQKKEEVSVNEIAILVSQAGDSEYEEIFLTQRTIEELEREILAAFGEKKEIEWIKKTEADILVRIRNSKQVSSLYNKQKIMVKFLEECKVAT
jgi:hypothetical protein